MWHKAKWMGHPMRLKLTCEGLLVYLANDGLPEAPKRNRNILNGMEGEEQKRKEK